MVALVSVAILGVQKGIVIAVFFSLVERLRREYRPEDGILLRDQKISEWAATRIQGNHRQSPLTVAATPENKPSPTES